MADREIEILRSALREHVNALAVDIGPRTPAIPGTLLRSANYLHSVFEKAGLSVEEQVYDCYDQRVMNVLAMHPLTTGAAASLHPQTAASAGLAEGTVGKFTTVDGTASLPVRIDARVAPGCVWIERGYGATAPLATATVEARSA